MVSVVAGLLTMTYNTKMKHHTLKDAVSMGEYEPKFLEKFEEWTEATRHMQFQYVREGIENRRNC